MPALDLVDDAPLPIDHMTRPIEVLEAPDAAAYTDSIMNHAAPRAGCGSRCEETPDVSNSQPRPRWHQGRVYRLGTRDAGRGQRLRGIDLAEKGREFSLDNARPETIKRLANLGRSEAVKKVNRVVAVSRFLNKFAAPVFEPIHPPRN